MFVTTSTSLNLGPRFPSKSTLFKASLKQGDDSVSRHDESSADSQATPIWSIAWMRLVGSSALVALSSACCMSLIIESTSTASAWCSLVALDTAPMSGSLTPESTLSARRRARRASRVLRRAWCASPTFGKDCGLGGHETRPDFRRMSPELGLLHIAHYTHGGSSMLKCEQSLDLFVHL